MNIPTNERKKTIRNLLIFVIALNLLGWLGWLLAQDGSAESLGLGTLLWLSAPLVVSLLVRVFSKDWKDLGLRFNFKNNGRWYTASLLIFPLIITITILIGTLFGGVSLDNLEACPFFLSLVLTFFSFTFVKNVLEEFAWRGYLTPRMNSIVIRPLIGHLLVGLIWGTWHIPYYLSLIDRAQLAAYTSQDLAIFLPMIILGITVAGIPFGEIRLITGSIWPAFLMHMISNTLILTLLVDGYLEVAKETEFLFTPSWEGIISMVLITLAGISLYQWRLSNRS